MECTGITSFLLSFKFEDGRSYFVHLAVCGRLYESAHLVLVPTLGHKLVAYFDPGLQKVLVEFFMLGTQELSHTCTFLECQRKKTN